MLTDLRAAVRVLRARPAFVAAVVLCLALGIAANSTAYSLLSAVVFRPYPFADAARLVALRQVSTTTGAVSEGLSLPDFADIRDENRTLDATAAYTIGTVNFALGDEPEGLRAAFVTPGYFDTFVMAPLAGRAFSRADATLPLVVIGERLWRERLGGDPAIVGRTVRVDGQARTVLGVMPLAYTLTNDIEQLWLPLDPDAPELSRAADGYRVVGRLRPGVTPARADADVRAIARRMAAQHPATNAGRGAQVVRLRDAALPTSIRTAFFLMQGAVTLVLLVACANVANLMLVHGVSRSHEMALRTALGASRGRLVRQLLVESVLLSLLGGAVGVVLTVWGLRAAMRGVPYELPRWLQPTVDGRVLGYTVVVAVVSGVLFGLAPALRAGRTDPQTVLRASGRGLAGGRNRRAQSALVSAQIALSFVLLVAAGLLLKSFQRLQDVDPGFSHAGTLVIGLNAGGDRFASTDARIALYGRVRDDLAAIPGVAAVAASAYRPGWNNYDATRVAIDGSAEPRERRPSAEMRRVLGDYFAALDVPLVAGRTFTDAEMADSASRVLVIGARLASRLWPGQAALGRRIQLGDDAASWQVVGVVPDLYLRGAGVPLGLQLYAPYGTRAARGLNFLVRMRDTTAATAAAGAVRRAVAAIDPTVAILDVSSLSRSMDSALWQQRFFGRLFAVFAGVALLLASIGLYGVVSYATSQRTREIGVRVALGARRADVYRLVIGRDVPLVAGSLALGVLLAIGATRLLASQLHDVSPGDPGVFVAVTAALALVAGLAVFLPARRATRVDPLIALRAE